MIEVLWRPLTFWDVEQIEYIRKRDVQAKLKSDWDIVKLKRRFDSIQGEVDELENEQEDIWLEMVEKAKEYWVKESELHNYI